MTTETTAFYAEPLLKPTLLQKIQGFDTKTWSLLTLDIDHLPPEDDINQILALLQRKLLDSQVRIMEINVSPNLAKSAQELVEKLLEAAFRANLQTLTEVGVYGIANVRSSALESAIEDNCFVREIRIPVVTPGVKKLIKRISQRNQRIADFENIEKKHLGMTSTAFGIGTVGSFISMLLFGLNCGEFWNLTILPLTKIAFHSVIGSVLMFPYVTVGLVLALVLPFVLAQSVINLRDYFRKRRYAKVTYSDNSQQPSVQLSLTLQQIQNANHLIDAINRADRTLNIPRLSTKQTQTQTLTPKHARVVTGLVQLANATMEAGPIHYLSTATFNLMMKIAYSSGYGAHPIAAIPRISGKTASPELVYREGIARTYSLSTLLGSLNPTRGRYNTIQLAPQGRLDQENKYDITFSSNDEAVRLIASNSVYHATVFVDSASLKKLAVAFNDNTTLTELTLKCADTLSEDDAQLIAQIIYRNSIHLRKFNLPDARFENAKAYQPIENALQCNGAITQFNHLKQDEKSEQVIRNILKRNQAMRREGSPVWISMSVCTSLLVLLSVFYCIGSSVIMSQLTPLLLLLQVIAPGVAIVAGLVIGALIALPIWWHSRSQALSASAQLHKQQSLQLASKQQFLMSAQQYRQAMRTFTPQGQVLSLLTREQKCNPKLRPDFPEMAPSLAKQKTDKDAEVKEMKAHVITTESGVPVAVKDIASKAADTVLKTTLSAPRFAFFALTNQVQRLTKSETELAKGAQLGDQEVMRIIEARDEYQQLKAMGRMVAPAS